MHCRILPNWSLINVYNVLRLLLVLRGSLCGFSLAPNQIIGRGRLPPPPTPMDGGLAWTADCSAVWFYDLWRENRRWSTHLELDFARNRIRPNSGFYPQPAHVQFLDGLTHCKMFSSLGTPVSGSSGSLKMNFATFSWIFVSRGNPWSLQMIVLSIKM